MKNDYLFTSESVSEGHPDKICDRISDAVVDLMLEKYSEARVACETMVSTNRTIIAGEYRLPEGINITNDEWFGNVITSWLWRARSRTFKCKNGALLTVVCAAQYANG